MACLHVTHQQRRVVDHGLIEVGHDRQFVGIRMIGDFLLQPRGRQRVILSLKRFDLGRLLLVAQGHGVLLGRAFAGVLQIARLSDGYRDQCHGAKRCAGENAMGETVVDAVIHWMCPLIDPWAERAS
ncbi:hypothetical protein GCM10009038_19530 [Salinicola rhizosphaerae]|uniref:Uncharacterized protein n=1 Tax=Salinicola rhizosphaerae TaxID=1443141 RepID=A0ABQ3DYY4_9GAMM|nr:hypothetical protein GCM10009038_19530 [Salinicola rhizosphaerae]